MWRNLVFASFAVAIFTGTLSAKEGLSTRLSPQSGRLGRAKRRAPCPPWKCGLRTGANPTAKLGRMRTRYRLSTRSRPRRHQPIPNLLNGPTRPRAFPRYRTWSLAGSTAELGAPRCQSSRTPERLTLSLSRNLPSSRYLTWDKPWSRGRGA